MQRRLQYIAFTFLLIFSVPVVYQNLHIIEHYIDTHANHEIYNDNSIIQHSGEECFFCEYKFTSCSVKKDHVFIGHVNIIISLIPQIPEIFHFSYSGNSTSLRAPPFFS